MKRMHATDGPKIYCPNTYNYGSHQTQFNNHNRFPHGGFQPHHNGYNNPTYGYYRNYNNNNNNNNSNNNNNHWRVYRSRYNNNPRHRYHNHNSNNNNHHQQRQCHVQHQHQQMVHSGAMTDQTIIQLPVPVVDENTVHAFRPPLPSSTPCGPDSSASSTKSESNSNCSEQEEQIRSCPLPQQRNNVAPKITNNVYRPIPSSYADSYDNGYRVMSLDDAIWKKFHISQQSLDIYRKKMDLWRELFDLFKATHAANYPRYSLQVVGSTMSGFGSRKSDVDICLMIRRSEVDQRIEAVDRLHELQASLQKLPYMENVELIYAKVPILKFRDKSRDLEVDLNCNNSVGIRNTHLLYCYSQLDVRVKPLVLVVKLWAQFHNINDAKSMTISSYSLVLMVIHYLQAGCKEPVLPCLHQMYPEKFSPYIDVEKIKINEQISKWDSHNQDSLGELLIGFLEYYARKFDYARAAVSVRLGCHVPIKLCMQTRSYKNDPHQWKYLCVEEPFDLTNTARSVYDKEAFDKIRGVFYASWQRLAYTRDLESIFVEIPEHESRAIAARMVPVILR